MEEKNLKIFLNEFNKLPYVDDKDLEPTHTGLVRLSHYKDTKVSKGDLVPIFLSTENPEVPESVKLEIRHYKII